MKEAFRAGRPGGAESIRRSYLQAPRDIFRRWHRRARLAGRSGCADLSRDLVVGRRKAGATIHEGGTYLCIEGPQFSSRAESNLYRSWGVDVISMTAMQEARLAREAELCYAALVLVTDYDCWHECVKAVDIGEILRVMRLNVELAQQAVMTWRGDASARDALARVRIRLKDAIITDRSVIPPKRSPKLEPIIGKYIEAENQPASFRHRPGARR